VRVGQPSLRTAERQLRVRLGRPVPFGGHSPGRQAERPGCDEERSVRTRERLAKGLDRAAISCGSARKIPRERDVVLERKVNHAIRLRGSTAQGVEIIKRAVTHLRPGGGEGRG